MLENLKRIIKIKRVKFKSKSVKFSSGVNITKNSKFEGMNSLGKNTYFNGKLGYGTYIGSNCIINASVGRYCCIADNVHVYVGIHPVKWASLNPMFYSTKKQNGYSYVHQDYFEEETFADKIEKYGIIVGNDVWIGARTTILGGITIGDGAVIGAGAVVTKNVPPYTIVGGVPAKKIKTRFDQEIIEQLLDYRWWEKSPEWIKKNVLSFQNVEKLLELLERNI